jgi:hypothetical protein
MEITLCNLFKSLVVVPSSAQKIVISVVSCTFDRNVTEELLDTRSLHKVTCKNPKWV